MNPGDGTADRGMECRSLPRSWGGEPVLYYDGACGLCSRTVRWVLRGDRSGRIRFCSLQSPRGRALLEVLGRSPEELDTMVFVRDGEAYWRARAVGEVGRQMGGGWAWAGGLWLRLPRKVTGALYDWVQRNRMRWFGPADQCAVPRPEHAARFLSGEEAAAPPRSDHDSRSSARASRVSGGKSTPTG